MRGAIFVVVASFALCLLFLALLTGRHSDSRMDTPFFFIFCFFRVNLSIDDMGATSGGFFF